MLLLYFQYYLNLTSILFEILTFGTYPMISLILSQLTKYRQVESEKKFLPQDLCSSFLWGSPGQLRN